MATSVELERLVVRLLGENTDYIRTLRDTEQKTGQVIDGINLRYNKAGRLIDAQGRFIKDLTGTTEVATRKMILRWDAVNQRLKAAQGLTRMIGRNMSLFVTTPILGGLGASVKAFGDFDSAMTKSTSIMRNLGSETRGEMESLAMQLSGQSVQSAKELADSYFFLASAGLNAENSMKALPVVQRFATAGAFDMARATDLLTDAQSALGLTIRNDAIANMENMIRVSDVLVEANRLANASVEQFSVSLTSKAGTALKTYNKDVEEGVAVLAAMADQGIKAELAGNQFDRILRLLAQSSRESAKEQAELGFEVFNNAGEMNNMANIIGQLEITLAGMSDEQKSATLEMLGFEARVQQAILPLIGLSENIKIYESRLREASGTTKDVSDKQLQSFSSQLRMAWNEVKNLGITIGRILAPIVGFLGKQIGALARWFQNLHPAIQTTAVIVALLVAAIGPLLIAMSALMGLVSLGITAFTAYAASSAVAATATGALTIATKLLGLAMKALPLVLVTAGIAAVTSVIYDASSAVRDYNAVVKESRKLEGELIQVQTERQNAILAEADAIEDETEKLKFLREELEMAKRNQDGFKVRIKMDEELVDSKDGFFNNLFGNKILAQYRQQLEDTRAGAERAADFTRQLEDAILSVNNVRVERQNTALLELQKDTMELTEELQHQIDTFGMSSEEIEIWELAQRGATEASLEQVKALQGKLKALEAEQEAMEELQKVQDDAKDFVNSLAIQIDTFGMSSHEAKTYALEMAGVTEEVLRHARANDELLTKMERTQKLMERGRQLTEQLRTPEEVFNDSITSYKELLEAGAIDMETFKRATEKSYQDLLGTAEDPVDIKVNFEDGINAIEVGSTEALARINDFRADIVARSEEDFAQNQPSIEDTQHKSRIEDFLGRIADAVEDEDQTDDIVLKPANIRRS